MNKICAKRQYTYKPNFIFYRKGSLTMYNKNELMKVINDAMFTCQRLYNISALGLWNNVQAAGESVIADLSADEILTKERFETLRSEILGNMYAAAEGDD